MLLEKVNFLDLLLTISNALGTITAILLNVNQVTTGNDLTGATVTRIRTLARYLDSINFPGNTNPLGTPDPTAEFPQEIYKIDRKSAENREVVTFELAAVFDLSWYSEHPKDNAPEPSFLRLVRL